jgi:hypothetical protein
MRSVVLAELIKLTPSKVSPSTVVVGAEKLEDTVDVTPLWIYIRPVVLSQLIKLIPSKARPEGSFPGDAKLEDTVDVTPL